MIRFRDRASHAEIGEIINEESGWGAKLDYTARRKTFGTTRAMSLEVPLEGNGYEWDTDGNQGYDHTLARIFGPNAHCDTISNYEYLERLVLPVGKKAVHFSLEVFEKPTIITRSDLAGLKRVDAVFDRLGFMTLDQTETDMVQPANAGPSS